MVAKLHLAIIVGLIVWCGDGCSREVQHTHEARALAGKLGGIVERGTPPDVLVGVFALAFPGLVTCLVLSLAHGSAADVDVGGVGNHISCLAASKLFGLLDVLVTGVLSLQRSSEPWRRTGVGTAVDRRLATLCCCRG